jgi:hypothetical protein
MTELIAKPIIKNKYWVVEQSGKKIATIQAVENGGFVYVHDDLRETHVSVKNIKSKYNIQFAGVDKKSKLNENLVYGYPATGRIYNEVFDVKRKIPIYTKSPKSRSQYCAGYFLIKTSSRWSKQLCPKNILITRYPYHGPFKTENEMLEKFNSL